MSYKDHTPILPILYCGVESSRVAKARSSSRLRSRSKQSPGHRAIWVGATRRTWSSFLWARGTVSNITKIVKTIYIYLLLWKIVQNIIIAVPYGTAHSLSREPRKRRPKHARIAPPCRLNWPCVSDLQSIYKAESWQRAVTLGDSTPQ